jgi:hypothetical protein
MRTGIVFVAFVVIMLQPTLADIVRRSSIPEPLVGRWVADGDDCDSKTELVIAATKYVDAGTECTIRAISETAGQRGTFYSARAQCPASTRTLIIMSKDTTHIIVGSDFSKLRTLQKCEKPQSDR